MLVIVILWLCYSSITIHNKNKLHIFYSFFTRITQSQYHKSQYNNFTLTCFYFIYKFKFLKYIQDTKSFHAYSNNNDYFNLNCGVYICKYLFTILRAGSHQMIFDHAPSDFRIKIVDILKEYYDL
jgi:hypothetical protein